MASGDVNGDGKDDIVMASQDADGTFSFHVWSAGLTYSGMWYTSGKFSLSRVGDRFTVGDYNGDGKADVAMAYDLGNGTMLIYRWTSTGSQFANMTISEPVNLASVAGRMASGDVNGDGKDDIVMASQNADGTFSYHVWLNGINYARTWYTSGSFNLGLVGDRFTVGDYNGDGKADVAMAYDLGNGTMRIYRWTSTGSQFTDPTTYDSGSLRLGNVADRMASGDVNGDGKDDIVMAYQNTDGTFSYYVWTAGTA